MRSIIAKYNIIIAINRRIFSTTTRKIRHLIDFSRDGALFMDSCGKLNYLKSGWVWFIGYDLMAEILCSHEVNELPDVNSPRFHDEFKHVADMITKNEKYLFINMHKQRWQYAVN